jgi:ParB family chromosome partitioning protein
MPAVFKSGHDTEPQEGAEDVEASEDVADEVEAHALAA